ncbi:Cof-type HAD-IIB family hydrolase [Streptococcus uberis]|uniref:Cof-type HAD-IIB family hydrolase n=1 Tax=Streptococcus uberis TaxID=1349 RepID=UPI000620411C|nr:Cof-type HAD-IIB family hydrolase [Streptococcus uberis]KKF42085.1 hydrolase [Streptococcus uberis Ab71]KKF48192.1 hydrolase [Streptococcus uberis C5072]KKF49232.1 hydrolase [Streptococcus uberis C8329]KKF54149.1 hydrolase [Streptococcus uberis B190]
MEIKVFATDMDGTFLNSQNDYDRAFFKATFDKLIKDGKKFVAISGNQYYQIKGFFEEVADHMTIVGENGAFIVDQGELLQTSPIEMEVVEKVITYLDRNDLSPESVVCGEQAAYILKTASQENKDYFGTYYTKMVEVDSFQDLPEDAILKFSFNTPLDTTEEIIDMLNQTLSDQVIAVATGHGNVDVMRKGINKGSAMRFLLDRWGLEANQLMAFGDSDNDLEMLALTEHSYAMMNANDKVKKQATFLTSSNDENGVLVAINKML